MCTGKTRSGFFDRVYKARDATETVKLYDEWAETYDTAVSDAGYATPARLAHLLARHMPDKNAAILDFGCGTGVSGGALAQAGFSTIDGMDISEGMQARAGEKGVYRQLALNDPGRPLPVAPGEYQAVVGCGVIGAGAAPLAVLNDLLNILAPGQILAFSFNDHTLEDPASQAHVARLVTDGVARQITYDYGPHLPGLDMKSGVYLLEKL